MAAVTIASQVWQSMATCQRLDQAHSGLAALLMPSAMLHLVKLGMKAVVNPLEGVDLDNDHDMNGNANFVCATVPGAHFCRPVNCFAFSPPPELTCTKPFEKITGS